MCPDQAPTQGSGVIEALYVAIQKRGVASPSDLTQDLGIARSSLTLYLKQLVKANRIERLGGGRSIKYRVVQMTFATQGAPTTQGTPSTPSSGPQTQPAPQPESGKGSGIGHQLLGLAGVILVLYLIFTHHTQQVPQTIPTQTPLTPTEQVSAKPKHAAASHPKKAAVAVSKTPIPLSQIVLPKTAPPPDGVFASAFCGALYNMKYQDPYANADAVAAMVGPLYGQDIVDTYYSDERMKTCQDEKQTWTFKAEGDPAMTAKKGDDSDYLVKGTLTITEEGNSHIDTRSVSFLVTINHNANGFPEVKDIVEQNMGNKE